MIFPLNMVIFHSYVNIYQRVMGKWVNVCVSENVLFLKLFAPQKNVTLWLWLT